MEGNWKSQNDVESCNKIGNYKLMCNAKHIQVLTDYTLKIQNHTETGKYDGNGQINWSDGTNWIKRGIITMIQLSMSSKILYAIKIRLRILLN